MAQTSLVKIAANTLEICCSTGKTTRRKNKEPRSRGPRYTLQRQMWKLLCKLLQWHC